MEFLQTNQVDLPFVLPYLGLLVMVPIALHLLKVAQARALIAHVVAAEVTPIPEPLPAEWLLTERTLFCFKAELLLRHRLRQTEDWVLFLVNVSLAFDNELFGVEGSVAFTTYLCVFFGTILASSPHRPRVVLLHAAKF